MNRPDSRNHLHAVEDPRTIARLARRAERRALLVASMAVVVTGLLLAFGPGLVGSRLLDLRDLHDRARVRRVVDELADVFAALPYDELSSLDRTSSVVTGPEGGAELRVEYAVSTVPDGVRLHAVVIDSRTREAIDEVVAWRART